MYDKYHKTDNLIPKKLLKKWTNLLKISIYCIT